MTTTLQLQPPEPFNFSTPDEWGRWARRFEQFRMASGLYKEEEERQVNTLLYCLGEGAEDVLCSTGLAVGERKKYAAVLSKFDKFFGIRKNVIFERARFNSRIQKEGELAEQFIADLYSLADKCEFRDFKEEMIRDRLVVGIRDRALSEKLQLDAGLSLEKAKTAVRQREAVRGQQEMLKGTKNNPIEVNELSRRGDGARGQGQGSNRRRSKRPRDAKQQTRGKPCGRCGKGHAKQEKCPAKDAVCHKCQRIGHFSAQCFSKTVAGTGNVGQLSGEILPDEGAYLDEVGAEKNTDAMWCAAVKIAGRSCEFKLDTGAEVTAVTEELHTLLGKPALQRASKVLYGPGQQPLKVLGQFEESISYRNSSSRQVLFVVRGLSKNLMGLPAITALNLATRVDGVGDYSQSIQEKFPSVFQGLGTFGDPYEIKLKDGAKPWAIHTARRVPLPLRDKVAEELRRMESCGVISRMEEPTEWCAGMVAVPKKQGSVRICVDLKALNENVMREVYPLPTVDQTLAQMNGATKFSKLDANSGFWQIPLSENSRHFTTFFTPLGRFCFNKLPFGICSAPEVFQNRMSKVLQGLEGVVCQIDDILVYGKDAEDHDVCLQAVLKHLQEAKVTLNTEKCVFNQDSVKFLGHVVDKNGIAADPEKVRAIVEMKEPTCVADLRRFLGMVNYLGKFSPHLTDIAQPLHELLSKKTAWYWGENQRKAFSNIKKELSRPTILGWYDPKAPTKIAADASSWGLGAVLLQRQQDQWKPIVYASRTMSEVERRYAQIEKEALAVTWSCEKFAEYILGLSISIETDHKPLVPLLSTKQLDSLPPRILRFRLRLDRFDYTICHVPGKEMYTADTLSRAPVGPPGRSSEAFQGEVEAFIESVVRNLPAGEKRLDEYRRCQAADPTCQLVRKYCQEGWPCKRKLTQDLLPYFDARSRFSIGRDLLLHNHCIVVPGALQKATLEKVHEGHQGIGRCRERARSAVWWPGMMSQMKRLVKTCGVCVKHAAPVTEPMIPSKLPDYPWQIIASDLFQLQGKTYLLLVDYFSRYPDIVHLTDTTSRGVINALCSIFSRLGIPEILMSDNGPQFDSNEMREFAERYGIELVSSSPHYPQSNGLAERTVKTIKQMLLKAKDPYLALLCYRTTPFDWCGQSPGELLFGRKLRDNLPKHPKSYVPTWSYLPAFRKAEGLYKQKQCSYYNQRHRTRPLPPLEDDTSVWISTNGKKKPGEVIQPAEEPRSYWVGSQHGQMRRNRRDLSAVPEGEGSQTEREQTKEVVPTTQRSPIQTRSRSGISIKPPERLYH